MLTVFGRPLGDLGINIEEDKTLYLDIDGGDISQVYQFDPVSTYIITTKELSEWEGVTLDGYFNIVRVESKSQITARFIGDFIATKYDENKLRVASKQVLQLYDRYGSIVSQLNAALVALRDDDVQTFSRIMSLNLLPMLSSMEDINKMVAFCRSMETAKNTYSELIAKAAKFDSAVADIERYKNLFETEKSQNLSLTAEKEAYKQNIEALQEQVAEQTISQSGVGQSVDMEVLQSEVASLKEEKEALASSFEAYKKDVEEQAALVGASAQNEVIAHLREELKKAQTLSLDQIVNSRMPILQESTSLGAEHIIYFKEVRPTVYINSFLAYTGALLNIKCRQTLKKEFVIIVLDTLCDQYNVFKYKKRKWAINSQPNPRNGILVTNCFDYSKLKMDYGIDQKSIVIIVDRTHVMTDAVQLSRAKKYYFINTLNDLADFGLDPAYCIAFMNSYPADAKEFPKYRISTWDPMLETVKTEKRCGKCSNDKILETILNEAGVLGS